MPINKVTYNNTTLIDLSSDTVAADKLLSGYTAHDNAGNIINGTLSSGGAPSVGSLIVINCSSNLTSVVARYGSDSAGAYLDTTDHIAYVVIPYTYTGVVYLDGYYGSEVLVTEQVSISSINKYTAALAVSGVIYNAGVWTGVSTHEWASHSTASAAIEGASSIVSVEELWSTYSSYFAKWYYHCSGYTLTPVISTRGFSKIKFYYGNISNTSQLAVGYSNHNGIPTWVSETTDYPPYNRVSNIDEYKLYAGFDTENKTATVDIDSADTYIYIKIIGNIEITKIEFI